MSSIGKIKKSIYFNASKDQLKSAHQIAKRGVDSLKSKGYTTNNIADVAKNHPYKAKEAVKVNVSKRAISLAQEAREHGKLKDYATTMAKLNKSSLRNRIDNNKILEGVYNDGKFKTSEGISGTYEKVGENSYFASSDRYEVTIIGNEALIYDSKEGSYYSAQAPYENGRIMLRDFERVKDPESEE